jgi:2,3-dihydroxy-2,3-dihydro-p-cumate dehydrogenase
MPMSAPSIRGFRMSDKLTGRYAIVTGGAGGIGRAIAEKLIAEGANVLIADLDPERAEACAGEIGAAWVAGDLSQEDDTRALVDRAMTLWGRIDILVNNAGGGVLLPFLKHTAETLHKTIDGNLWTCLWGCRLVLPVMVEQRYGRIVNMGGDSVRNGLWLHAGYNAAKGGVHGLTTGLAREFAQSGITVNAVAPSIVATPSVQPLLDSGSNRMVNRMVDVVPMGRAAEMTEIASAVAYLASDEASFITGQVISVNGGSTML